MDDEERACLGGIFIGVLITILFSFILHLSTEGSYFNDINSGEEFILGNATYKCTKTNELLPEGK